MSTKEKKINTKQKKLTNPILLDNNEQSDRMRYNMDLVNGWISCADSKIGTFGTVFAVVAAVFVYIADMIFSNVDTTDLSNPLLLTWSNISALLSFLTLILAIILCLFALNPSLKSSCSCKKINTNHFSIFYEDIFRMVSGEEYIRLAKKTTEEQFTNELMREIYINSGICSKKMHLFRIGIVVSILSIIFYLMWVLFYVLAY